MESEKNMTEFLMTQGEYFLRIALAAGCGVVIGYERENNLKTAGIPTHSIVALAAALMMIISKYGFADVLNTAGISLDPSRIAAGVIQSIGFLGAGVIFTRKMSVSGLTTSAGLWATVGIGCAIGSGMYAIGISVTVLIMVLQFFFNKHSRFNNYPSVEHIVLEIDEKEDVNKLLDSMFQDKKIKITNISVEKLKNHRISVKLYVKFPASYKNEDVVSLLKENPEIISIDT